MALVAASSLSLEAAQKSWRCLDGNSLLPRLILGSTQPSPPEASCTISVMDANALAVKIHRMLVVLSNVATAHAISEMPVGQASEALSFRPISDGQQTISGRPW
jgi:hypothetical protein